MYLLVLSTTLIEIAIFSIALFAFLLTVRFFILSQRRMEGLLPESGRKKKRLPVEIDRDGFIVPTSTPENYAKAVSKNIVYEADEETKSEIKELRGLLQLQQLELTRAISKIENLHTDKKETYEDEENQYDDETPTTSGAELDELRLQLQRKETELKEVQQQNELSSKLQGHFEEVQAGYEELQEKVQKMEQQAWQSAEIAIKLDNLEQANEQLEKTVLKKEEKLRELTVENGRLHEVLNQTEDKLTEANLQRQQLIKKVHFLEEIGNDIQQMSDANRKLKNELRRVAELESMLNLITEERDALLKRRSLKF